jgi:hypothetical protein
VTDPAIYRHLLQIQQELSDIRRESELNLVTLNRLGNAIGALTDEIKNINHVLKRLLRLHMAKGEKL